MSQLYMSLKYEDWKALEDQCIRFPEIETSHETTNGYYHKAFRLALGDLLIEFQGPLVKAPDQRNSEMDPEQQYKIRGCRAGADGDCTWAPCPQKRDGEPTKSQRHCPLDVAFPSQGRSGG